MDTATALVFTLVVAGRFVLPLFIPRLPLPAIIACLVLDGIDQTIFQTFGYDPPGYQGYDKAMDVFYLAVAYMSTLRNWTNMPAFQVARFLYFYRLVGVVAFELIGSRTLLLIFPNTFEYFFIAYEVVRLRWDPARYGLRFWVWTAGLIWVFVKLPQEWWIHIAQLDFTDALEANAWLGPAIVAALLVALVVIRLAVWPRLDPADWTMRIRSDPLPEEMDGASERAAWLAAHGRVLSGVTVEKVVLVGLLCVVYAQVLPGFEARPTQVFVGLGAFVVLNAGLMLWAARRAHTVESLTAAFAVRVAVNVALVGAADWLLGRGTGRLDPGPAIFFVLMLSLLTVLHDRYWPVHAVRLRHARPPGDGRDRAGSTGPASPS